MAKPLAVLQGLSRLLAIPVESLPVGEPHTDSATARDGAVVGAEPLAPDMCRRIEELVKLRHRAGGRDAGGRRVFVLPFWLTADSAWRARTRSGSILVHVDTAGGRRVTVSGVTDNRRLGSVALSPRKPEAWRRRCIARTAARIRRDLTLVLGSVASDPAWLSEMASAPEAAERAAIAVWNRFLEAAAVPAGLRIPGFELSVAELLEVRGEQTGNGNREWFANRWPAAAAALLRGGEAEEMLRRLDGSRAAAAEIATKTFCCNRKQDCERARRMVQAIPRYRDDRGLARVLAGCGPLVDVHIRAIVMHANYDDGSLLARMAQRSQYAREHMALAAAVATNPLFRTSECRMKVGELIARTLAGSGYDPSELVPEGRGQGAGRRFRGLSGRICRRTHIGHRSRCAGEGSACPWRGHVRSPMETVSGSPGRLCETLPGTGGAGVPEGNRERLRRRTVAGAGDMALGRACQSSRGASGASVECRRPTGGGRRDDRVPRKRAVQALVVAGALDHVRGAGRAGSRDSDSQGGRRGWPNRQVQNLRPERAAE